MPMQFAPLWHRPLQEAQFRKFGGKATGPKILKVNELRRIDEWKFGTRCAHLPVGRMVCLPTKG
jgi:hypothetical protein